MKARSKLLFGTLTLIVTAIGYYTVQTLLSPQVLFATTRQSVGVQHKGALAVVTFAYSNRGRRPAKVSIIRSSCACTAVSNDDAVPPGGTGLIRMEVDTSYLPNGPQVKFVEIATNDPWRRTRQLSVALTVEAEFSLSQSSLDFGEMVHDVDGKPHSQSIAITTMGAASVDEARMLGSNFDVRITKPSKETRTQLLTVTLRNGNRSGQLYGTVVLRTSSSSMPEIRVPVQARILRAAR